MRRVIKDRRNLLQAGEAAFHAATHLPSGEQRDEMLAEAAKLRMQAGYRTGKKQAEAVHSRLIAQEANRRETYADIDVRMGAAVLLHLIDRTDSSYWQDMFPNARAV